MKTFTKLICMLALIWLNAGTARAQCQAYFYATNDSIAGNLVHVQNNSQGSSLSYTWNFGDGSPLSKGFDPHHQYAAKGTYNICLTISSSTDTACHSNYCMSITTHDSVTPPPPPAGCQAYFYATNDSIAGNLVHVQNNSQGSSLSYTWNFGDGSPLSKGFDPHHQYAVKGTYNICLNITSQTDTACHSQYCFSITTKDSVVTPPPAGCQAYFYAINDSVTGNLVHTQNHSQGTALSYTWNFGDGSPLSKGFDPHHQYAVKGTYNICLNITSQTDTACHSQYCFSITTKDSVVTPPPAGCQAYFYAINDSVTGNLVHTQNHSQGTALSYTWNFGDGSPLSKGFDPHHQYAAKGTYNICLNITSQTDTACHSQYCFSITTHDSITPPPPAGCQAYFYAINDSVTGNLVHTQNHSQGTALSYTWNFGDGSPLSKGFDPHHQYAVQGTYNICLNITSQTDTTCHSQYCFSITTKDSVVTPPPAGCQAAFVAMNDSVTGNLVRTHNYSQGTALMYAWDFGDGSPIAKGFDPHHQYAVQGTYIICLTVTSQTDTLCNSMYCDTIVTNNMTPVACHAMFQSMPDSVSAGKVHFYNASTGNNLKYEWNFGDGKVSHDANPSHVYASTGAYTVCLHVSSQTDTSCHSSYCSSINVKLPAGSCKANFYTYVSGANLTEVHIKNVSSGAAPLTYTINYGDGNTGAALSHKYAQSGTYNICLTISGNGGCTDTKCMPVTVGGCKAGFYLYKDTLDSHAYHAVNTSSGHNIHYTWNFGDGSVSNAELPSHTYQNYGKYYVCVNINDSMGCSDVYCDSIIVTAKTNGQILFDVVAPDVATAVSNASTTLSQVAVYPNPVADIANLNITTIKNEDIKVNIVNVLGQVSKSATYKLVKGQNTLPLDVADLSQGIYYLVISSANNAQQVSLKFVK